MLSDAPIMALVFTVLPPVLPAIAQHFGGGADGRFVAQMIMTMPSIGLMLGGLVSGWLVDRVGARTVLFVSLLAFALFGSAGLYLDDVTLLLITRFLVGVASTSITTSAAWLLAASYEADARIRLLGYRNALGSVFGLLSLLLAGPAAEWGGWRLPFSFYLASLAVFAMAVVAIPGTQRATATPESTGPVPQGSLLPLWPIYALTVPLSIILIASATQLSFLLEEIGLTRPSVQSWIIGAGSATSLIGAACYGFVRIRLGVRGTFVLLMLLMGVGNYVIGQYYTATPAAVGCGIAGFGSGIATPYLCNLVFDQASEAVRGRALGMLYSAMFFGDFLNPVVFHALHPLYGIHGAFSILGAAVTLLGLLSIFTRHRWASAAA